MTNIMRLTCLKPQVEVSMRRPVLFTQLWPSVSSITMMMMVAEDEELSLKATVQRCGAESQESLTFLQIIRLRAFSVFADA